MNIRKTAVTMVWILGSLFCVSLYLLIILGGAIALYTTALSFLGFAAGIALIAHSHPHPPRRRKGESERDFYGRLYDRHNF